MKFKLKKPLIYQNRVKVTYWLRMRAVLQSDGISVAQCC